METALNLVEYEFLTAHYTYACARYQYHNGYFYDLQEVFDFQPLF